MVQQTLCNSMEACPVQEMYRKGTQADPAGARQRLITDINEVRRPCNSVLSLNSAVSPHACIDFISFSLSFSLSLFSLSLFLHPKEPSYCCSGSGRCQPPRRDLQVPE